MRTVGIKTLKNKLSEYIRAAAAGETILVTDRNRVVAQVSPPAVPATHRPSPEEWWDEQVRKGVITPARDRKAPMPRNQPLMKLEEILRDQDADREDR